MVASRVVSVAIQRDLFVVNSVKSRLLIQYTCKHAYSSISARVEHTKSVMFGSGKNTTCYWPSTDNVTATSTRYTRRYFSEKNLDFTKVIEYY